MEPISSLSRPYIYTTVKGASGSEQVEIAFTNLGAEPTEGDWKPAEWASTTPEGARARILIGPGSSVVLPDGTYLMWVRVTGAVERPVLPCGSVPIT
ncbi:hypothetical protein [Nonomuraea sediminis]|uniref:hypothetical protein n=1 Tax=Nonomuraea sediminis TaxID=2835864 RepID=UPI001BDBFCF7|nr:hypothetical protein [Nonomuraea sediminis]